MKETEITNETRWAVFAGSSDDTFGIVHHSDGVPSLDDDDCAQMSARAYRLMAPNGAELLVIGQYTTDNFKSSKRADCDANWIVGVAAPDSWEESECFWTWPARLLTPEEIRAVSVAYPAPYTPHLLVEMPVGTLITLCDGSQKTPEGRGVKWGVVQ